jgi:hypothetical protein
MWADIVEHGTRSNRVHGGILGHRILTPEAIYFVGAVLSSVHIYFLLNTMMDIFAAIQDLELDDCT